MLGLFLLGYFVQRATKTSAAAGMAFGLPIITWMSLSQMSFWRESTALRFYSSPFHSFLIIVFGTLAIFLVGFLICLPASLKKKHSSGND
jgi:SSS family solute:Na+ symporter